VILAFHQFDGKVLEKECPKALNRKVSHLRLVIKKTARMAPWATRGTDLLDSVERLVNNRHNLIHGALYASGPGDELTFLRMIHDKAGFHTGEMHTVTLEELKAATVSTRALAHEILTLGFELMLITDPRPEIIEDLRKLGIKDARVLPVP
jgi:hypothetical protein